ncbi:MAG: aldehyde dehydrogenase family protein [Planctomycetota bacterium]|nr:aldehyde dehydrogenase family protein [Planctomycetota bacterium]
MASIDPDLRALQEVRDAVARAKAASASLVNYDQAGTDRLCQAMVDAAAAAAHDLARLAVEETGIGRVHYKILKNIFAAEVTWDSIRDERTVGVIEQNAKTGVTKVAVPSGVVAGIVPTTNPTSTAIFKALIAVKGRNSIVISPHPRARRCIGETVEVLRRALERVGGPPDLVNVLANPTIESTGALMRHRDVALILATGGAGLVRAAYSSGKPAYGVGPGNVPVFVDRSANLARAARDVVTSQSFDNATFCCSEQALVLDEPIADKFLSLLQARGAHLCCNSQVAKLGEYCNRGGAMNADVVGQDPWRIAEAAGFSVPKTTTVLLAPQGGVGPDWPLSIEILCPLLSVHRVDGWEAGCHTSIELLKFGGLGHTIGLHSEDRAVIDAWALQKPASRIVVNGPTSQGAVGYSTGLVPSVSLGCGPQAGNITSDNISARHLVNIKRVATVRGNWTELERAGHERAAALTGEAAPRGSGLPGDPALSPALPQPGGDAQVTSGWRGNPAQTAKPEQSTPAGGAPRAKVISAEKTAPRRPAARAAAPAAPRFSDGARAAGSPVTTVVRAAAVAQAPSRPSAPASAPASAVGASLSADEIRTILSQAGSGCPLGPCQGCPHQQVTTGACTA